MLPHHILIPVARDPYAHPWHGQPFIWGGEPESLTFTDAEGEPKVVGVLAAHLSIVGGQNVTVAVVEDYEASALVAVARVDNSAAMVLAVEHPASLGMVPGERFARAANALAEQAAARMIRGILEPIAVQRVDSRPLPQTHAVLVREFGDDFDIVKSARKSYRGDKTKRPPADDRKLLRYLMRHRHTSPFEQVALVFEVTAPLYVVQQLLRHRTAKLNQQSGRYIEHDCEFELTPPGGWRTQGVENKQGSGNALALDVGERLSEMQAEATEKAWYTYRAMIEAGVSREQARTILPASTMTGMVWQCDLHNLLNFLGLRLAPDAQLEIRRLAAQMAVEVARRFPWTWAAWLELAAPAAIREMVAAQAVAAAPVIKTLRERSLDALRVCDDPRNWVCEDTDNEGSK